MNLVSDLDLPPFDDSAPDLLADRRHQQLAEPGQQGWLAKSPLPYIVLDRDCGEFFWRSRATAFPGVEGIYGIDKPPIIWSGPARPSPDHGPGAEVTLLAGTRPRRVGLEG